VFTKLKAMSAVFAVSGLTSLLFVGSAAAASINGDITQGTSKVAGASMIIVCKTATKTYTHTTVISSSTGHYNDSFSTCPDGSTLTITATKGNASGTAYGVMGSASAQHATVNVPIGMVALPEFKPLAAVAAGIVSVGALLLIRKRSAETL